MQQPRYEYGLTPKHRGRHELPFSLLSQAQVPRINPLGFLKRAQVHCFSPHQLWCEQGPPSCLLSLQFGVDSEPFCTQKLQDRPAAYRCAGDAFANACAVLAGGGFGAQAMVVSRMLWLTQALSGSRQHRHLAGLGTGRGRHGGSQLSRLWKTPRTSMKERMSSMAFYGWKS